MARGVRFLTNVPPYSSSDSANFDDALAADFVQRGVGRYVTPQAGDVVDAHTVDLAMHATEAAGDIVAHVFGATTGAQSIATLNKVKGHKL